MKTMEAAFDKAGKKSPKARLDELIGQAVENYPKDWRKAADHVWLNLDGDTARVAFEKYRIYPLDVCMRRSR